MSGRCTAICVLLTLSFIAGCRTLPQSSSPTPPPLNVACVTSTDSDDDGLSDTCEHALATAFAPTLVTSASACNVIGERDSAQLGGGYLFIVQPTAQGARIAYLPAYYRDCGWSGLKCMFPGLNCAPHAGDSEFIALDVTRSTGAWTVDGVFLSAHCFGSLSGDCRWYRGDDLRRFEWPEQSIGGPVIWVADGRNANYPSREACWRGHAFVDTCNEPRLRYRFPTIADRNIGSRQRPARLGSGTAGCVLSSHVDTGNRYTLPDAIECVWQPNTRFRGWQETRAGVTPYARYLTQIAGF